MESVLWYMNYGRGIKIVSHTTSLSIEPVGAPLPALPGTVDKLKTRSSIFTAAGICDIVLAAVRPRGAEPGTTISIPAKAFSPATMNTKASMNFLYSSPSNLPANRSTSQEDSADFLFGRGGELYIFPVSLAFECVVHLALAEV